MDKQELIKEIENVYQYRDEFANLISKYEKIIILGNGGSNAISAHIAQDLTKQLGKKAFTFSDPSRLTCYINDYGMKYANKQFLKEFADKDTLVILISSSGNSDNMFYAQFYCIKENIPHIILTGFNKDNKMRKMAEEELCEPLLNIYVNSHDYGVVECVHQILLHSII